MAYQYAFAVMDRADTVCGDHRSRPRLPVPETAIAHHRPRTAETQPQAGVPHTEQYKFETVRIQLPRTQRHNGNETELEVTGLERKWIC